MTEAPLPCPECDGVIEAGEWFCPRCFAYRGSLCPTCGRHAGLGEGLCPAGHLVSTPEAVLEKRREARSAAAGDRAGPEAIFGSIPRPPGPRYPRRPAVADPLEFVGRSARALSGTLGPPDDRRRGLTLEALEGAFGPRPSCLPERTRFEEWVYHNVAGEEWVFWIVQRGALPHPAVRSGSYVADFTAYPSGAVF